MWSQLQQKVMAILFLTLLATVKTMWDIISGQ